MQKLFLSLATVALFAGFASAQAPSLDPLSEPFKPDGFVTMAFGKVRQADGTLRDITGMKVPYRVTPIAARNLSRKNDIFPRPGDMNQLDLLFKSLSRGSRGGSRGPENVSLYSADSGLYGYIEENPSSLDDVTLPSSSVNKAWSTLTFGIADDRPSFSNFLIRWRVWSQQVTTPAPGNSFSGLVGDFGVIWNQTLTQGTPVKVEININAAAMVAPTTNLFMATQFRDPSNLQGNGAFVPGVNVVFSTGTPPTVGSSQDQFWYDWDPLDGNYNENEIDIFEGALANILYVIKGATNSFVTNSKPTSFSQTFGQTTEGNLISSHFENDADVIQARPLFNGARNDPLIAWDFEAFAPSNGTIIGLRVTSDTFASTGPFTQRIFLWNYLLSSWIQVNESVVSGTTPVSIDVAYGGLLPLSNFLNPSRQVRARVGIFRQTGVSYPRSWTASLDRFNWTIVRTVP
ncbi:MAG: hypothetical protein MUC92_05905 [Fimbriimonadaceae bacterium]|jgi:hypothetical protein|nr:hypothetical protein [Fimbriimonadaceae bacterium]